MIILRSDMLKVVVLPDKGAQIVSLQDSLGHEFLSPGTMSRPANLSLSASFNDGGLGGIDDCLPAIAPGAYPVEPYGDWRIPDHGEVWLRTWQVEQVAPETATLSIEGLRLPIIFTRAMTVSGNELHLDYTLENHGLIDLPIMWALHPMFQPTFGTVISLDDTQELIIEACNIGLLPGSVVPYPVCRIGDRDVDLRRWNELPVGFYLKAFAPLASGWTLKLTYPEWAAELEMITTASTAMYVGVWLNRGGFPEPNPVDHFSIEPTFGASDSLATAYRQKSCLILKGRSQETWSVVYRINSTEEPA